MNKQSFYCAARATPESRDISATVRLPWLINTDNYELALVYFSAKPTWETISKLSLTHESLTTKQLETVSFDHIPVLPPDVFLHVLSRELEQKFGSNMSTGTVAKIQRNKNGSFTLKVGKKTKLKLSPVLAQILGVNQTIPNDTNSPSSIALKPKMVQDAMEDQIYYVSCDEIATNYSSNGLSLRILDVIQMNQHNTVSNQRSTLHQYCPLEGNILTSLTFRLLKRSGEPILSIQNHLQTDFYVLVHLRQK